MGPDHLLFPRNTVCALPLDREGSRARLLEDAEDVLNFATSMLVGCSPRATAARAVKFAAAILVALTCSVGLGGGAAARPNVIFIMADDLGYGDLGCFGQKRIRTPHIDQLAAEGMRFTQAYAGATVCAPSRCSFMTGLHNGHAHVRGNREIKPEGQTPMPAGTFTLGRLMQRAGYRTGIIGKWGLGYPGSESTPDKMGFDEFFGYNCQRQAHEYYPEHLWRNDERVVLNGEKYSHDLMAEEALDFVRRHREQPFFLFLAFTIPHQKLQVPDLGPYADEPWPEPLKKLAAMITRMDGDVGRLLALLQELGLDEKTLVFFASDNGAAYNDDLFNHSGPLRGRKRDMYEGGIRSPSIARWPGRIEAGKVSDQVWAFWDVLPTLAELTGQEPPDGIDGVSILPALLEGKRVEHPPLYFEFHERGFHQAARIGDWKAVRLGTSSAIELYDLKSDLGERNNVADRHPAVVQQFETLLASARTESELWPIREDARRGARRR
jgi:arylsulfatase A-like enzyme